MSETIVVWMLIGVLTTGYAGGPIVVDNIATRANCQALGRIIEREHDPHGGGWMRCVAVRKALHAPPSTSERRAR